MSLRAIASELGLSVTTVSRALGGYPEVAAATRHRVLAEARRIDYRPNQLARRLRQGRSEAVGLVLPADPGQFGDPFFLQLLAAVGPPLRHAGLDLLVMSARPGLDEIRAYLHLVEGRRVDGILLARTRRNDARIRYLLDCGVPFVAHGRCDETRPYAFVDIDGAAACQAATQRLIGFGHRRIGLINAAPHYTFAHYREQGWRTALAHADLPPGPVRCAEPSEEAGFTLMRELLAQPHPPTAVLCATDRLAIGALHAVSQAGLRAGRDMSLIGYDDLPMASCTDPPLTTIEQAVARVGPRMVEMLTALLHGADPAGLQEIWPTRLIPRGSDGPAPHHADPQTKKIRHVQQVPHDARQDRRV
ncbi:MAG TPA: substrate-binding domain-containing protein [Acetobacteraceae bacterium]|nr:substrate-binding domain-containing protein [Acetobacteraceae bacterium]